MMKEEQVVLIVDHRESRSGLIDELIDYSYQTADMNVTTCVEVATLEVGDIICSDRVGIERKSGGDFVESFINRDLFGQISDLARTFKRPAMILEGETVYGLRAVHPEALRAAVSIVTIDFGIPMIPTSCVEETAYQVVTTARREQFKHKRGIGIPHTKRSQMTMPQRQEYVVSSIGVGVGPAIAVALLEHFGSVQAVMAAPIEDLVKVEGIGVPTAKKIHGIVRSKYKA